MSLGGDPTSASSEGDADREGTDDEGLRLPDLGPVSEVARVAEEPGEVIQGPSSSDQGSLAERGGSNQGSAGTHPSQEHFPQVGTNFEVVGYSYASPLPPASEIAAYESVLPGAAERILAMAELAVRGPIDESAKLSTAEIDASKRGLTFAMRLTLGMSVMAVIFFILAVAGIGTAAALTAGGVCLSIPVVMLIRSFITRS